MSDQSHNPTAVTSYEAQAHIPTPLFKNRNFLLLWLAYVISALGDRIHFVIMLALLAQLKHKTEAGTQDTAQLNVMMLLPFLLLGPITGVIADRLPRRAIMVTADFVRVAIVLIARTLFLAVPAGLHNEVPGLGGVTYAVIMLLCSELLLGIFSALFSPARNALMPNLVHPNQLLRANSMTNSAGTIASLLGFVIGAVLIKHFWTAAMFVDAGTFLCSGLLLLGMSGKALQKHVPTVRVEKKSRSILKDFGDALRYLRIHKRAVQVILLMFLFWCCGAIILSGLTGVVTGKFGKTTAEFSTFLGLICVGMMAGAASCSLARKGIPKEFGIAFSMAMVGVFFFLFSVPESYPLAVVLLIIAAFFGAIMLVSLDTLLQRIVPDFMRGRVMALRDQLANVGLVGVAIPLAISSAIDDYIILILRIVAVVVFAVGVMLMVYYYRRQALPWVAAVVRRIVVFYLLVFKRFSVGNAARIPSKGPVIFVSNHSTSYDPLCMQAASKFRLIQFMMAKEFYEKWPLTFFLKWLKTIPVNRTGNDTASIRTAIRALNEGACIGMFPEGGISDDGRMLEGKQGVALLALMSKATVVPAYIQGTEMHAGMVADFLQFNKVTLYFGKPIRFDDLKGRGDAEREVASKRIMDAITGLRDKYESRPEWRMSSKEWRERHPKEAAEIDRKLEEWKAKRKAEMAAAKPEEEKKA